MQDMVKKVKLVTEGRIVLSDQEIRKLYKQSKRADASSIDGISLTQQK